MTRDWRTRRLSRRYPLLFVVMLALIAFVTSASGVLAGSTFDAFDGNLTVENAGAPDTEAKDWADVDTTGAVVPAVDCVNDPAPVGDERHGCGLDKPTGTGDDSFGQGTSENDDPPSVVSGSIPNNKSDLSRFYLYSEKASGDDFLFLAWERVQEPTGTTNMDFEFNQNYCDPTEVTPPAQNVCSTNGVTPVRKQGDLLIKYDLSQGGVNPTLGYHLWQTQAGNPLADTSQKRAAICEAGNKFPCWGKGNSLSGFFEGSLNTVATDDPIQPDATRSLSARTFGEAGINLSDSGLFPAGECKNFGSAYLKSRSSDSFTAEIKDFIAPIHVNVSNCAKIELVKDFVSAPTSARANLYIKNSTNTTTIDSELDAADLGTTGKNTVFAGSYNISETAGSNTDFATYSTTVSCIDEANGGATVTPGSQVLTGLTRSGSVAVAVSSDIKCTFTNTLLTGAIKITKTGKDARCIGAGTSISGADANCQAAGLRKLTGATFAIKKGGTAVSASPVSTTNGVACADGLVFGTNYTVQETGAPTGYKVDNSAESSAITVSASSICGDGNEANGGAYTDTPLTTIQVKVNPASPLAAGVTNSSIVCSVAAASENGDSDAIGISVISIASPTVITTSAAHGLVTGQRVTISGATTTPSVNGDWSVTFINATQFSIPLNVTAVTVGTGTATALDDTDETFGNGTSGLVPGTYTCTIHIDP